MGHEKRRMEISKGFAVLKKSAAKANADLGLLEAKKAEAIAYATEQILKDQVNDHFSLVVWQTGSGTQSNMNVNEVMAFVGNKWLEEQGSPLRLHPNDDVNKSQSSNDTYPTSMHIASVLKLEGEVLPAVTKLKNTLIKKSADYDHIVKLVITYIQDATPITLGQEISGWVRMLE